MAHKLLGTALPVAMVALFAASNAFALPTLRLTEGGLDGILDTADDNVLVFEDNAPVGLLFDRDSRLGVIDINTNIGVFDINFDIAITKPQQGSASDPQMEVTYRHGSTGPGQLRVEFSETDFDAGAMGPMRFLSSNSGETDLGSVQFQVFVDDSNVLFGQGANVGDTGEITAPSGFTQSVDGVASLTDSYSLTQVLTFRNFGPGAASGDTETEIPVPGTLGLLGAGLMAMGLLARRRKTA